MHKIMRVALLGFGLAVVSFAVPSPPPTPFPQKPVKAPEMDLAFAASAATILAGSFIWMRYRRKR